MSRRTTREDSPEHAARTTRASKLSAFLNTLPTFLSKLIQDIKEDPINPEIVTSRPDLTNRSLQLMRPFWKKQHPSAKELMFAAVSSDFIGVSAHATIKALKVFVTLTFTPIRSELQLKLDKEKNILEFWAENRENVAADPFVNAFFLYIAFQSHYRRLESRYLSMLETYDYRTFPEYIHHLPRLLEEFITTYYIKTSYEATSFTTVGTVIPCLEKIQQRNTVLETSYGIMELLDKLSRKITKKEEEGEEKRFTDDVLIDKPFFQRQMRNIYNNAKIDLYDKIDDPSEKILLQPFFNKMKQLYKDVHKELLPIPIITNYYKKLGIKPLREHPEAKNFEMDMTENICVVGRSGYGKTNAVLNFIKRTSPDPSDPYPYWTKIVVFSGATTKEPLYANLHQLYPNVELINEVSELNNVDIEGDSSEPKLIIFDDFITLKKQDCQKIRDFAIKSRSQGWTRIFIVQKLFGTDGLDLIIRTNCRYFMLFRFNNNFDFKRITRDVMGVSFAKQPTKMNKIVKCYEEATQERLNFFLYDTHAGGTEEKRGRKNFLGFCGSGIDDQLINFYDAFGIQKPPRPPKWDTLHIEHPARICIIGATGVGKTNVVVNLVSKYGPNYWKRLVIFSPIEQELYTALREKQPIVDIYNDIKNEALELKDTDDPMEPKLIIFDDFITTKKSDNALVRKYAIASRKYGWTCIFLAQKFAGTDGLDKVIRDQCTYYIVMPKTSPTDLKAIKQFVNVDTETFEKSYQTVEDHYTPIRRLTKELQFPFVLIDEETDDIKLKVRIGFDYYYSMQKRKVLPVDE